MEIINDLFTATGESLYMVGISLVFAYLIGLPLGVVLVGSQKNGLFPHRVLHAILGWIVDMTRSVPFIILMILIIPLTRLLAGTAIGTTAAIVPLTLCAIPFVIRMVEQSLLEVDNGKIEAAQAMGAKNWQIIVYVYLGEAIPSLVRGVAITAINIIGYSAMAGALGGGGLGNFAITHGFYRFDTVIIVYTVLVIIVLVIFSQGLFNTLAKRIDHRK